MHFPPKIRQILPPCDNCDIKNGRKQVKKFGQPWLILTVQYLVCILTVAIFACVTTGEPDVVCVKCLYMYSHGQNRMSRRNSHELK